MKAKEPKQAQQTDVLKLNMKHSDTEAWWETAFSHVVIHNTP